jgi:hypothetical protein
MKKNILLMLFVLVLSWGALSALGQSPTYYCEIRNENFLGPSSYQFDLYLTQTGSEPFELANYQVGIGINASFTNGGTIAASLVGGFSELEASQVPVSITFDNASLCLKIAPKAPPRDYVSGVTSGTLISPSGTYVCTVLLNNSTDFSSDPAMYEWKTSIDPYRTVVSAFLPGSPKQNVAITSASSMTKSHQVAVFLEGLYPEGGGGLMNKVYDDMGERYAGPVAERIGISLAQGLPPYDVVYSAQNVNLNTNGMCSFTLPASFDGSYYIVVTSRNHLETWSAEPISFGGASVSYSFADLPSKAFGDNTKFVADAQTVFAGDFTSSLYSYPDIPEKDGVIDIDDVYYAYQSYINNDVGFLIGDLNGDAVVDINDTYLAYNNYVMNILIQRP